MEHSSVEPRAPASAVAQQRSQKLAAKPILWSFASSFHHVLSLRRGAFIMSHVFSIYEE
jgi:hypothetical protein